MMLHHLTSTATDPTQLRTRTACPNRSRSQRKLAPARLGRYRGWDVLAEANRIGNAE